jgi:hypothetical protein
MVVWNIFFTTILLPLVGIALLWRRPRRPGAGWVATLILAGGMVGFGLLVAPWGWFGVPLRILLALLFALAIVMSLRRPIIDAGTAVDGEVRPQTTAMRMMVMILIGFFFGSVATGVLRAHHVPPGAIDLGFPLTRGTYIVGQGGSEPAANNHMGDPAELYAVDLMKLNAAGMRARGIYPNDANAYAVFGDAVVSPCDGVAVEVMDGLPDAARISLDEKNPAGNHVVLRCGDFDVTLAHLRRGSVAVRLGGRVTRGAPLARVGNSGTSTEPHLHVHASRYGAGVPLRFEGRWLVRNALIRE